MQQFIQTSLLAGDDGVNFNDIYLRKNDGSFVVNNTNKDTLDIKHPIKTIVVHGIGPVRGLSVTYRLASGDTTTIDHGSRGNPRQPTYPVPFEDNEVLVGIFGHYKPDGFYSMGFVINDQEKGTVRTFGPFGNPEGATPFYCSDVIAFGGFAKDDPEWESRICGLYFFKNVGPA